MRRAVAFADEFTQIVRFTFSKIVRADPNREFIVRLTIQDSRITGRPRQTLAHQMCSLALSFI